MSQLSYQLPSYGETPDLGSGAIVIKATEIGTDKTVAIKASRVSKRVKRPILQHEVRLLQLLSGHRAIPLVYGYGQLEHFEYMSMELLGLSIADQQKKHCAGVMVKTVIRVVDQVLAGLKHIHLLGIVHCDMKPENLLCAFDETTIKIVDFGISKLFSHGRPSKYDPFKDRRGILGSLYWTSLNSHNGIELSPRDDVESLAYTALFLLRANLPWKPRPPSETQLRSQEITRLMKSSCSSEELSEGFPPEFGTLLTSSRSLEFNQLPDHESSRYLFATLAESMGGPFSGPLDWTPCYPKNIRYFTDIPVVDISDDVDIEPEPEDIDIGENSYYGMDLDSWVLHGERDKDLTLPAELEAELDSRTPLIVEVALPKTLF